MEAITAYSFIPLRLVALVGFLFLIFALLLAAYTLAYKFVGLAVSGFTTVIVLQLFIGSVCMISIGIAGEYIARIYEEVKYRPRYIIAKRVVSNLKHKAENAQDRLPNMTMG